MAPAQVLHCALTSLHRLLPPAQCLFGPEGKAGCQEPGYQAGSQPAQAAWEHPALGGPACGSRVWGWGKEVGTWKGLS